MNSKKPDEQVFLALGGSLMVSYVKARAEGLGLSCDAGYFTRPERVLLIAAALLAVGLSAVLTTARCARW